MSTARFGTSNFNKLPGFKRESRGSSFLPARERNCRLKVSVCIPSALHRDHHNRSATTRC